MTSLVIYPLPRDVIAGRCFDCGEKAEVEIVDTPPAGAAPERVRACRYHAGPYVSSAIEAVWFD